MLDASLKLNSQKNRLRSAIILAGARYTPKLNVEVSIYNVFYGLGRTREFFNNLKSHNNKIGKNFRYLKKEKLEKIASEDYITLEKNIVAVLNFLVSIPNSGTKYIDFKKIIRLCTKAQQTVHRCLDRIREEETKKQQKQEQTTKLYSEDEFREERHYLYQISDGLRELNEFSESNQAIVANKPLILLKGIAGAGKTHLLCDLSEHRLKNAQPTFIFLGEEFDRKNPWEVILNKIGFNGKADNFLSKLSVYAKNKRARAVIIIDAVNESVRKVEWSRLNIVKKYKNIGLILSVRNGFERECIPASIDRRFLHLEHEGFVFKEWEAVTKFFGEYNLPLPEVPLLFPEFRIPLFLKIFCESYKKSKDPIKGHFGFARIFEHYVIYQGIDVLQKLNEATGRQASKDKIWNGIIKEIALYMGEKGIDRISESKAVSIVKKVFPKKSNETLAYLEKFWLITKVPKYNKKFKQIGFEYRFPYQKFSDHLIVRNLLNKHLDKRNPVKSFLKNTVLGNIVRRGWSESGLIEALSIQIPERLKGRELIYVAPKKFRTTDLAKDSFLQSLIWRDLNLKRNKAQSIKQKRVLNYINKHFAPYYYDNHKILETLIAIAAIPKHPLNAYLLHKHLLKFKMPERDRFWIPFLNSYYGEQSSIDRLIAWAWDGGDKSKINKESVKLAGITLAWFLSSPNRFLRDRATKSLVSLLEKHTGVLMQIISEFEGVDDLYIMERLYAVAYGCALRNQNKEEVIQLAIYTYKNIFKGSEPPVHFLLRDYARGIIELALLYKKGLKVDIKKIRPPYGSNWPKRIPSLGYLKRRYYSRKSGLISRNRALRDYGDIWHSLMYNNEGGIADFGNYVVNSTLRYWANVPILRGNFRTKKEIYEDFLKGLSRKQKYWWNKLEKIKQSVSFASIVVRLRDVKDEKSEIPKITEEELKTSQQILNEVKNHFLRTLNKRQKAVYKNVVTPYQEQPREYDDLDYAAIQRLIFSKVIKLGWKPEYFAEFDSRVGEQMRAARKSERIGKKYQWIAFHEVLARVADNFAYRKGWSYDDLGIYGGSWETWRRDIDPSCLLKKTNIDTSHHDCWWSTIKYNKWRPSKTDTDWVRIFSDLPKQKKLLEVKDKTGKKWLVLEGYFRWEQPDLPGRERYSSTNRQIWYLVRGYLVKKQNANELFKWAKQQDFSGGWILELRKFHSTFLREFPHCQAYIKEYDTGHKMRWSKFENKNRKETRFKVLRATEQYLREASNYDCSVDDSIQINLPAKEIYEMMGLVPIENEGEFKNKDGVMIAVDPSVSENGPGVLLVKKQEFLKFLERIKLEIIWTVSGEKLIIGCTPSWAGRLEMGGTYKMGSRGILLGRSYRKFTPPQETR